MEGWVNQTGTETNRKKNRSEPREPKPNQTPSEKPKRTETKRGFTVIMALERTLDLLGCRWSLDQGFGALRASEIQV